ncbi:MAG: hypothetical protein CMO43_11825 [Verrucomicrobiales bacterium]|nr:hypothetical protein [Verrucomicrobiales bacterium]
MIIPVYKEPSREERQRDYDSFRIDDQRFDALSFDKSEPFSLSLLGHHWFHLFDDPDLEDCQVITNRNLHYCLAKTKETKEVSDLLVDWNVSPPDYEWFEYPDSFDQRVLINKGDYSNASALGLEIEQETPDSVWAITLLVAAAERVFKPVMKAAQKGNEKAIHAVHYLAHKLTHLLSKIAEVHPAKIQKISMNSLTWPILFSPNTKLEKPSRDFVTNRLHIGSKLLVGGQNKAWGNNTLTIVALELIHFIDRHKNSGGESELGRLCQKLPRLTKARAVSDWWPVGKAIFEFSYPEPHLVDDFDGLISTSREEPE